MKHEDLLEGVRSLISDIPADYGQYELLNALEAVINLHKPFMYEGRFGKYERCSGCASEEEWLGEIYPCPTIQAIQEELK